MYQYEWDEETGGLLLTTEQSKFSKEPRPVYYKELDTLGFDKYWTYPKDESAPIMWAEANNYIYRGRNIARTKGGSINALPELIFLEDPEPVGTPLKTVDLDSMVIKNRYMMDTITQETIQKIYNTYMLYKNKVDLFYVAFSGGKDSVVTLDLVQRSLPHDDFIVLFGDTCMEFPDTYNTVNTVESKCMEDGIEFLRAKSEFSPEYTWRQFGPPATVTRWCCSVHKTVPQVIALREYTGKPDFTGVAFVGVRGSESIARSKYEYISLGEKHKGQYSCNPILDWDSSEVFLYIYTNKLTLNEAYKKGNRRAGCLVCPRASERNECVSSLLYQDDFCKYTNIIRELYSPKFSEKSKLDEFMTNGGWKARKNGRDLPLQVGYSDGVSEEYSYIIVKNPKINWKIWIKTIGVLLTEDPPYKVSFKNRIYSFEVMTIDDGYEVHYDTNYSKSSPEFVKLFKNVFKKSACCIGCRECEVDCHNGCIHMHGGLVEISDHCIHCAQCHKVEKGCLVYKSLEKPKGGSLMANTKSLNCYSHHAPKIEWINQYFNYKNEFDQKNTLGSNMLSFFKRFLRDAELLDTSGFSKTAEIIDYIGLDHEESWAIMLTNLSYSPQINWFVTHLKIGETYTKDYTISLLTEDGAKESWVKDVWSSFARLLDLPFNKVGMGTMIKEKNRPVALLRTPWEFPDERVILYSLYKFSEQTEGKYQFSLTDLMNVGIDQNGVSPAQIFGLSREAMVPILNGLAVNYPGYISVSFTLGLDTVTLQPEVSSSDILKIFTK